ncbi:MAG: aldo/keto reductase [Desulfurococcales archaeon]|nr:aldo/keto reductase [Desulfurococcales archaeon]
MPKFPVSYEDLREIGKTGEKVPAIGLGTWNIRDPERAVEALTYAIERGLKLIDTAEMYGDGDAERLVGIVVKKVGRDRVFVTTKLLPHRFRSREDVERAMKASLSRLGLKSVDLVLIHWPDSLSSLETQIRNLEYLAERGYTRYIGVSNFDYHQLKEALTYTRKHEIVVDQVKYSVVHREPEARLLPYAIEKGITVQAYTPIERGYVNSIPLLKQLAEKYGKTPVQVALNFLLARPRVIPIPKTERKERVDEFIGAMGWRLSSEDIEKIENMIF